MPLSLSTLVVLGVVLLHAVLAPWIVSRIRQAGGSVRVLLGVLGVLLLALGVVAAGFAFTALELEQDGWWLWIWLVGAAGVAGFWAAKRSDGRLPSIELLVAGFLTLEVMAALLALSPVPFDLASASVRNLLVAPAPLGLCLYFGASVGLLVGSLQADPHLGYESAIGRRFLLSKSSSVLSTVTTISVMGVALGVWLVLVSLSVLSGFETDLQNKIMGVNAHMLLQKQQGDTFYLEPEMMGLVEQERGVVAASPLLEAEVAVASQSNFAGALMFGIDPIRSRQVLDVLESLPQEAAQALLEDDAPKDAGGEWDADDDEFAPPAEIPKIVLGVELAKSLNVRQGDTIRVISPILEVLTPLGPAPRSLGFKVAGVFSSQMYEFDARYVFVSLRAARQFLQLEDQEITGVQVKVRDPERSERVGKAVLQRLPDGAFEVLDWKQRNQTLISALKLERVVAFMVLVFIIFVASFAIVNTLSMSVIEKRKEIAILKTMGARDLGIMKIFLVQGVLVGGFGTVLGVILAVLMVLYLKFYGFAIPGDVYYIDSLPVNMTALDVVLVVLAAGLIVWNFAVFPALRGAALKPVEGLRDG